MGVFAGFGGENLGIFRFVNFLKVGKSCCERPSVFLIFSTNKRMTTFYFALIFIAQTVVIIFYALYPVTEYKHFLQSMFPTKKHLALVNGACAISIFSINKLGQFFCVPVAWAVVVLILFAFSMVLYPFFEKESWIKKGIAFVQGVGFLVCIYCILFYNFEGLLMAVICSILGVFLYTFASILTFFLLKIAKKDYKKERYVANIAPMSFLVFTVLLPYFWLIQIIIQFFKNDEIYHKKMYFGLFSMLFITFFFVKAYKNVLNNRAYIAQENEVVIQNLQANFCENYMLERAIGWALVYHTEICIYDGWRPPMHDPFLVVSDWIWRQGEPLTPNFDEKIKLYKKFYPNVSYKKSCSCAIEESKTYFQSMNALE
jgi:hypothetical protein